MADEKRMVLVVPEKDVGMTEAEAAKLVEQLYDTTPYVKKRARRTKAEMELAKTQ